MCGGPNVRATTTRLGMINGVIANAAVGLTSKRHDNLIYVRVSEKVSGIPQSTQISKINTTSKHMRNFLVAALFVASASVANAGMLLGTTDFESTEDGQVFTLSIFAEEGQSFRGIDASFTGEMNQQLAAGMATPFTNFDAFLPNGGATDSKFLFASGDVLAIGVEESPTSLVGAISGLAQAGLSNPAEFARIVVPEGGSVEYRLAVDLGGADAEIFTGVLGIPEPSTAILAGLALVGFVARRK